MLIMTIESSCDETSAAIVRDGRAILSNAVASQIPVHRRYGGVVPELASRNHIRDIHTVITQALTDADVSLTQLDAIGVTAGPGLVGSLLVGIETAKALAYTLGIPCVPLNHLEGHLTAVLLDVEGVDVPSFPYVGLVVSGGHTDLYLVHELGRYELLGRTRDDAAGEAFDKVAKMLGLPYPGGVEIDQRAALGDPKAIDFPRPMWTRANLDFSFSGLKTAVRNHVQDLGTLEGQALYDVCASFQAAVVDVLVMKTFEAVKRHKVKDVVVSGGVACNSALRAKMREGGVPRGVRVSIAPPLLCTDNAAMLGAVAQFYATKMENQTFEQFKLKATSNLKFGSSTRTRHGAHR